MPRALEFLTTFNDDLYDIQIRASYYFSFVAFAILAMGLAFEMPIFMLALVRLRVVSAAQLRRNWRMGILVVVVGAVLLPTVDPVSLALETMPLVILYFLSVELCTRDGAPLGRRPTARAILWATSESDDPLRRLGAPRRGRADPRRRRARRGRADRRGRAGERARGR